MFRYFLSLFFALFAVPANSMVYDCFLFFNELEILRIRMMELYDKVDRFVIVESEETFTGNPKPMYFHENRQMFKEFLDKVIYVPVQGHLETDSAWERERFQRNQIMQGLKDCSDEDIVFISDVDEIPKGRLIPFLIRTIQETQKPIICQNIMYRYFLDAKVDDKWPGTYGIFYKELKKSEPEDLRLSRSSFQHIENAGWHFTSIGGLEIWVKKVESFSHTECNLNSNKTLGYITRYVRRNCDIVPVDESYPWYIFQNLDYFKKLGFLYSQEKDQGEKRRRRH